MLLQLEETLNEIGSLKEAVKEIRDSLDIDNSRIKIDELQKKMQEPDFWSDINRAQEVTEQEKFIKSRLDRYEQLNTRIEDVEVLTTLSIEEVDLTSAKEILKEVKELQDDIERFRIEILLSGEYDKNNAIISLHVGVGGTDAQDWTEMLLRMYTRWAERKGFKIETIDILPADDAGIKSADLRIIGEFAYGYLKAEKGIHRLVRISPFNANGKRQTSFASIEVLPELTASQDIEIRPEDIRVDSFRSGGAGGQHVNKTESAIRITHIQTGIVVQCQNQRSQHHNKDEAMKMLKSKLVELKERSHKEKIEDLTGELKDMGWGSQIRSYVFQPYTLVKDHRTGVENGNINAVINGEIDEFINEYLKQNTN
ncbi:peptide chain release factor 2 [Clostridium thailandense]|uniref:peptide chain release factor 2 n=1 Tax=Clostridium thailandense TaxID=2794346 RepID=UPI00398A3FA8